MQHSVWQQKMAEYLKEHESEVRAPALRKGDVLFWNSRTIHGSLPTQDPKYSRRSLTAHYLPSNMTYGNLFTSKPWIEYEEVDGNLCYANQPEYSIQSNIVSAVKKAIYDSPSLMKLARKARAANAPADGRCRSTKRLRDRIPISRWPAAPACRARGLAGADLPTRHLTLAFASLAKKRCFAIAPINREQGPLRGSGTPLTSVHTPGRLSIAVSYRPSECALSWTNGRPVPGYDA